MSFVVKDAERDIAMYFIFILADKLAIFVDNLLVFALSRAYASWAPQGAAPK